jgi:hypothetical protein
MGERPRAMPRGRVFAGCMAFKTVIYSLDWTVGAMGFP